MYSHALSKGIRKLPLSFSKGGYKSFPLYRKRLCYWLRSIYLVDSVRNGSLGINLSPIYCVGEVLHHLLDSIGTRKYNKCKAPEEKRENCHFFCCIDLQSAQWSFNLISHHTPIIHLHMCMHTHTHTYNNTWSINMQCNTKKIVQKELVCEV